MNELVSVIIPVYNGQDYIGRCIESLLSQTYQNIEIVIVNDGSTDATQEICLKYAADNDEIFVWQQENKGVAAARNLGIEKAKGTYICFADADDYVGSEYIEVLVKNLIETGADLSLTGYTSNEAYLGSNKNALREVWDNKETLTNYILQKKFMEGAVCKLFTRSNLGDLRFNPELRIAEDKLFTFQAIDRCEKIVFQNYKSYYYFQREGSAMHSQFDERHLDSKYVADTLYEGWCFRYPDLTDMFYKAKIMTNARRVQYSLLYNSEKINALRTVFLKEIKSSNLKRIYNYCNKKEFVLIFMEKYFLLGLCLYEKMKRFLQKAVVRE